MYEFWSQICTATDVAVMTLIVSVNLHTLRSYFVNRFKQAENLLDHIYDLPRTPKKNNY